MQLNSELLFARGWPEPQKDACITVPRWDSATGQKVCPPGNSRYERAKYLGRGTEGFVVKIGADEMSLLADIPADERATKTVSARGIGTAEHRVPLGDKYDSEPGTPVIKMRFLEQGWADDATDTASREMTVGRIADQLHYQAVQALGMKDRSAGKPPRNAMLFVTGVREWSIWRDPAQLSPVRPYHIRAPSATEPPTAPAADAPASIDPTNLLGEQAGQKAREQSTLLRDATAANLPQLFPSSEMNKVAKWMAAGLEGKDQQDKDWLVVSTAVQTYADQEYTPRWGRFAPDMQARIRRKLELMRQRLFEELQRRRKLGTRTDYELGRNYLLGDTVEGVLLIRQPQVVNSQRKNEQLFDLLSSSSQYRYLVPDRADRLKMLLTMLAHQLHQLQEQFGFIHGDLSVSNLMISSHAPWINRVWTAMWYRNKDNKRQAFERDDLIKATGTDIAVGRGTGYKPAHITMIDMGRAGVYPGAYGVTSAISRSFLANDVGVKVIKDMVNGAMGADMRRVAYHIAYVALYWLTKAEPHESTLRGLTMRAAMGALTPDEEAQRKAAADGAALYHVDPDILLFCANAIALPVEWIPAPGKPGPSVDDRWTVCTDARDFTPRHQKLGEFVVNVGWIVLYLQQAATCRGTLSAVELQDLQVRMDALNFDLNPWLAWLSKHHGFVRDAASGEMRPVRDHATPHEVLRFEALKLRTSMR